MTDRRHPSYSALAAAILASGIAMTPVVHRQGEPRLCQSPKPKSKRALVKAARKQRRKSHV